MTNAVLEPFGKTMTAEIKANLMGRPDAAAHLLESLGMTDLISTSELIRRMDLLLGEYFRSVQPLPGVRALVEHLKQHGIPMAIATGSKKSNYLIKTGHLDYIFGHFGDKVICGDDPILQGKGKPDPTIFLEVSFFPFFSNLSNFRWVLMRLCVRLRNYWGLMSRR